MSLDLLLPAPPLGVVPILVNAGQAFIPALIAGLAGFAALVFKPKELVAEIRRKPWIPLVILGVAGAGWGLWVGVGKLLTPAAVPAVSKTTPAPEPGYARTDWTQVAFALLAAEERARAGITAAPTPAATTPPATFHASAARPLVFRQDYTRTGHDGSAAPLDLEPLWQFTEDFALVLSAPLVDNDAVFGAYSIIDPPNTYGAYFRLDATTGKPVWKREQRDTGPNKGKDFAGVFSSPALTADRRFVIFGQGLHPDANCELVCLDAATGRTHWLVPTPLHIESSPAIDGDLVVVGVGAIEDPKTKKPKGDPAGTGNPGFVLAVRISTGEVLWRFPLADPEGSPALADGVAYIGSGFNGQAVVALRTGTDEELRAAGQDRLIWSTPTPHPATGAVTLAGDLVLVGCGNGDFVFASPNPEGFVFALDRTTGRVVWKKQLPDAVLGAIAVRDGIAIAPVRNGEIVALDVATGDLRWRTSISRKPALGAPAFTGTHIYATSADGFLSVLDARDGKVLERVLINTRGKPGELGLTISSPTLVGGRVYVGSETGGLRAFTGKSSPTPAAR